MVRKATSIAAALIVAICVLPTLCFLAQAAPRGLADLQQTWMQHGSQASLLRSLRLVATVALIGLLYGWPLGTWLGTRKLAENGLALAALAMLLVCPPFVWAVGVQGWKGFMPFAAQVWFDGFSGHVIASSLLVGPLVALLCAGGLAWRSRSSAERLLIAGGKGWIHWVSMRSTLGLAVGAALLGSMLIAGEVGTGQMMGWQGMAGVIHSAFATEHDFHKAASRAWLYVCAALPLALTASGLISRVTQRRGLRSFIGRHETTASIPGSLALNVVASVPLMIGFVGLARPLTNGPVGPAFRDAWLAFSESLAMTLWLGAGVGAVVVSLALLLGCWLASRPRAWNGVLALGLLLVAMPPSIHALGWLLCRQGQVAWLAKGLPTALEMSVVLALRWTLIASHFMAQAWCEVPRAALDAAKLMGLGRWRWLLAIVIPSMHVRTLSIALAASLVALGDVSAVVLLQPPGWATYGMRLFSIMDNSPEKQVAAMCVVYFALPLLTVVLLIVGRAFSTHFGKHHDRA